LYNEVLGLVDAVHTRIACEAAVADFLLSAGVVVHGDGEFPMLGRTLPFSYT
jgi:hypothetical protein